MKEKETLCSEELEKINSFTRRKMSPDEIYTFPVVLCDNEIDRDCEKFTPGALEKMAELYVGKTGIFDHNLSGKDQTARIYSARVERDETRKTADGEPYTCLKAMAYMVRSEKNKDLIAEIDAGIKKEISVNCNVKSIRCSVCGKDKRSEGCEHLKGALYGGRTCFYILDEPSDAYEWSFVAVPAQKNAGITKSHSPADDIERLYREDIKKDITLYAGRVIPGFCGETLEKVCAYLPLKELREVRDVFEKEANRKFTPVLQLASPAKGEKADYAQYII